MIIQAIQIGNFHPLLVHLPIGIILLAFTLEIYNRYKPNVAANEIIVFTLGVAGVTALASLGTGWLLGDSGDFDADLLFLHRWMAVAFTVTTLLLFILKRSKSAGIKKLYIPVFILVLLLITATGHFGGNMTHGEDYLFNETSKKEILITDVVEADVYPEIIQPILDAKCVSCHNPSKLKGGLLLSSSNDLLKGGDSGSIFDTIEQKTLLMHVLHLPVENEEHMPPKGKVQLTPNEIELLQWWVANKHCFDCKTKELKTSEKLQGILTSLEVDNSPRALIAKQVDPAPQTWLDEVNTMGISIYPIAAENPLLIASLFGEQKHLKNKLLKLEEYAENIVELNLGNTQFNDTLIDLITPFKHLTKLQLQQTKITDQSITTLEAFEFLESLNLYGTPITNKIFDLAKNLPNLKALYLYETAVTEAETEQFQNDHPAITVQHVPKDAFKAVALSAPTIIAETSFFKDSLKIAIENTFEGSKIFYTLDGTIPDSTSTLYKKPFNINTSVTLQAIVTKTGWKPSEIGLQKFKTTSVEYSAATLNKKPNEKYKGNLAQTLIDLKRGTTNFVDGAWLGYEGTHFSTTLTLKEKMDISSVSVGAMSAPSNWIFYPAGLTIYTSQNGKDFKKIKSIQYPEQEPNNDVVQSFFDLNFEKTKAKYVKVEIKSPLKNPSWHTNPGGKSWIFVDEIILN